MQPVPQVITARELQKEASSVIERTENGPIFLMNRTEPRMVLVSPTEWNRVVERLDHLESMVLYYARLLKAERDPSTLQEVTLEELDVRLNTEKEFA